MKDKLNCCLIYLPKPFLKQPESQAPLGLMYLASSLREKDKSVIIENYASYSDEEAIARLPEADLYGITITSLEVLQANRFAAKMRNKYPNAKIVVGGPGVYAYKYLDFRYIDSAVFGDGEITIHEVLIDAQHNKLKMVYHGKTIEDLDSLPLPARDLLTDSQGGNIFAYDKQYSEGDSTIIVSSRGCPMKCAFCSAPALTANNKLRFRSPQKVAEEMKHVKETYGINQFRFSDDFFTANEKRTLELCEAIGPLDVHWRISLRVKPLNETMLKALKDAGCKELSYGIESFDDNVLKILNKNATAMDNVKALEMSDKYGFSTRILMMIRTPGQTPDTITKNKYWLERTPFSIIANTALIPIPGCDIWANPLKYGVEILNKDLDMYNFYMFGPEGRRKIDPIMNIIGRDINEYHQESEEFRNWLENDLKKVNKG